MEQTISLYVQVRQGYHPDLAAVGAACIAFDAALKEAASRIDPFNEFRFEIERGLEGSLNIQGIIRPIKDGLTDPKSLMAIAFTILGWMAADVRSYLSEQAIEEVIGAESDSSLSDKDVQAIAREVVAQMNSGTAEASVRQIFSELQKDEMIEGVGVTPRPRARPSVIVPRIEFDARAKGDPLAVEDGLALTRDVITRERVLLVSPVLLPGNRRWRFKGSGGEFGAPVKDEGFINRVLSGEEPVAMRGGIIMDVEIETQEQREGDLWRPRDRIIRRVFSIEAAPEQIPLFGLPPDD